MLNAGIDKQTFERRVQSITSGKLLKHAMTLADQYRQEGLERGELNALHRMLLDVLVTRFEAVPSGLAEMLNTISDVDRLTALHKAAIRCASLDEFAEKL